MEISNMKTLLWLLLKLSTYIVSDSPFAIQLSYCVYNIFITMSGSCGLFWKCCVLLISAKNGHIRCKLYINVVLSKQAEMYGKLLDPNKEIYAHVRIQCATR